MNIISKHRTAQRILLAVPVPLLLARPAAGGGDDNGKIEGPYKGIVTIEAKYLKHGCLPDGDVSKAKS